MPVEVINLNTIADKLQRPFSVTPLATAGDLTVSLYVCQGQINWHRHPDEDELFLVHEGVVQLDTERGKLTLHSEELAVVPKGVGHRTGSQLRSVVLLIRPTVLSDRKNGHRQHPLDTDPPLEKVRLARVQATLGAPYRAATVAQVEDFELLLLSAEGDGPAHTASGHDDLWLALRGAVDVVFDDAPATHLEAGELLRLPAGTSYQIKAAQPSILLTLARSG
jgi:mannose-6-phosphate isomerase-like protein (cupin superfamily)